ncbi:MAG TPA: SHOCT domain-containing protein [Candidatus Paceibacterota bacterium]
MGCLIAIIVFLLLCWLVESPGTFFIGIIILIILCIWAGVTTSKKNQEEEQRRILKREKNNKMFKEKKLQYNIKENHPTINYKNGFASIAKTKQYIWIQGEKLCFFPAIAQSDVYDYTIYSIPLKDIEYYASRGEISKETKISGGGGVIGGSSIGGAIVGGVIAGGAGAVIGSRKKGKIEPIKSEIIKHDNRETFLNYFIDGVKHSMFFYYEDYTTFLKVIPEKEYNSFVNVHISKGSKQSFKEQLIDLADLKEKGILSEEEFNEKKKILLDKII